jgi:ABC-2 type transport system permease protein
VKSTGGAAQVAHLARRSVVRTLRQPANVIAPVIFPLGLLAVNSGGLMAATKLPGFPTDSYTAFALAVPFMQGALFATMNAGTDLARDIQTGFLNRLALTPMRGAALLAGQLAGIAVAALVQAMVYVGVGIAVGVHPASGPAGVLVLLVLAVAIALAFGAVGALIALRTGSGESVQGFFPILFVFLLISSMNLPRNLIEIDWFRHAATANPVSYLIEGIRSLVIEGWNAEALGLAFAVTGTLGVLALAAAAAALRVRMART